MRVFPLFFLLFLIASCAPRTASEQTSPGTETVRGADKAIPLTMNTLDNQFFTAAIYQSGQLVATPRPIKAPQGPPMLLIVVSDKAPWLKGVIGGKTSTGNADFDKLMSKYELKIGEVYALEEGSYGLMLHFAKTPDDAQPAAQAFSSLEHILLTHIRQAF